MSKSKAWLTVAFSVIAALFASRASYAHTLHRTNKIKFNTVAYDHVAESDRLYYPENGWLWKVTYL